MPKHDDEPLTLDNIAEVRRRKKAPIVKVPICLDSDLAQAVADADAARASALVRTELFPGNAENLAKLLEADEAAQAARAAARAESTFFVFQSIGRKRFEELRDTCPASIEQQDRYRAEALNAGTPPNQIGTLDHDPQRFPAVLISACCISPKMTVDDAQAIWDGDEWSQAELTELFTGALTVNTWNRRIDLGKG